MFARFSGAGTPVDRRDVLKSAGVALAAMTRAPAFLCSAPIPGLAETMLGSPLLFPKPQEMKVGAGHFVLDSRTAILLPSEPSAGDVNLSRRLISELSDWNGIRN
jgi:hypothetical protein